MQTHAGPAMHIYIQFALDNLVTLNPYRFIKDILRFSQHKIDHFGNVLSSQSRGLVLTNKTNTTKQKSRNTAFIVMCANTKKTYCTEVTEHLR